MLSLGIPKTVLQRFNPEEADKWNRMISLNGILGQINEVNSLYGRKYIIVPCCCMENYLVDSLLEIGYEISVIRDDISGTDIQGLCYEIRW